MTPLPGSLSPDDEAIIQDLLAAHGFETLTHTQQQAFEERILDGGNQMLVAETRNGKTLCAEAVTKQIFELQIAYKFFLGTEKDFEDALYLYQVFEEQLDEDRLQRYVTELGVTEAYDELRDQQRENIAERRAFVKQWAEFVRTHSDEEWSAKQNKLIDSQVER